ncbi:MULTISPECIES: FAD-dependent monooxygenase [Paenibacillus]|nr:FAD-dependent monooxygenase [Paenibacillus sp. 2003]
MKIKRWAERSRVSACFVPFLRLPLIMKSYRLDYGIYVTGSGEDRVIPRSPTVYPEKEKVLYNLGWKLAAILHGADAALLETYNEERRAVAQSVMPTSSINCERALVMYESRRLINTVGTFPYDSGNG